MGVHDVTVNRRDGVAGEVLVMRRVYWTAMSVGVAHEECESYEAAVAMARSMIKTFDYTQHGGGLVDTVASVALRAEYRTARTDGVVSPSSGGDQELLRFEVYRDRVVLVPAGQGGLSDEQAEASKRAIAPRRGAEVRLASGER